MHGLNSEAPGQIDIYMPAIHRNVVAYTTKAGGQKRDTKCGD